MTSNGPIPISKDQAISEGWWEPNHSGICMRYDCNNKVVRSSRTSRKTNRLNGEYIKYCSSICANKQRQYDMAIENSLKSWQEAPTYTNPSGYVIRLLGRFHPRARCRGRTLEHILVMEDFVGRKLIKDETVHHLNGIKNDNRIENLELWSYSHPPGQRVEDLIKWAQEILDLYGC